MASSTSTRKRCKNQHTKQSYKRPKAEEKKIRTDAEGREEKNACRHGSWLPVKGHSAEDTRRPERPPSGNLPGCNQYIEVNVDCRNKQQKVTA